MGSVVVSHDKNGRGWYAELAGFVWEQLDCMWGGFLNVKLGKGAHLSGLSILMTCCPVTPCLVSPSVEKAASQCCLVVV